MVSGKRSHPGSEPRGLSRVIALEAVGVRITKKTISCVADCEKVNWFGWVCFKRLSELSHNLIRGTCIHVPGHFPNVFQELGSWNHHAFMLDKVLQNFDLQLSQTNRFSSYGNFVSLKINFGVSKPCLLYTSPSPRDRTRSRMPSSA